MRQPKFAENITDALHLDFYKGNEFMTGIAMTIDDPSTKRIMIDGVLWESLLKRDSEKEGKPPKASSWPFDDSIYLESTKPIMPGKMQTHIADLTRAVAADGFNPLEEPSWLRAALILPTGQYKRTICNITTWGRQIMANTMELDLTSGKGTMDVDRKDPTIGELGNPDNMEASINLFTGSVASLMVHIADHGITLEQEQLNRAERRRMERQNRTPLPWYRMKTDNHQDR